ncbi:DUF3616 domain-containing protein [Pseudoduganella plicata]|uniref:DUF3616 domain-containing protein n=1 Tax=Pseudoduganella plicata TaxID=321984 RepID=A0ABX5S720_9BURK|nr:DUF3616 domain-containing protein [Pseudoduganella plicata]
MTLSFTLSGKAWADRPARPRLDRWEDPGRTAVLARRAHVCYVDGMDNEPGKTFKETAVPADPAIPPQPYIHYGICDASAALALDERRFVVADDERSVLNIFRFDGADAADSVNLDAFLGTGKDDEADLEGCALSGDTIYWIGSHGADGDGMPAPLRRVLFATRLEEGARPGERTLRQFGRPYRRLLEDFDASPAREGYDLLGAALMDPKKEGGLSIEGLAETPRGALLIGLRNPVPADGALVLTLENPADVVQGGAARFGPCFTLDLGGLGIRSIERHGEGYYIVAGPFDKDKSRDKDKADRNSRFALFRWSGIQNDRPERVAFPLLAGLTPEALFFDPAGTLHILSDDGRNQPGGNGKCKNRAAADRQFRRIAVPPGAY